MTIKITTIFVLAIYFAALCNAYAEGFQSIEGNSYAQEYGELRKLLQQVQNRESALAYKSQIAH